MEETKANDALDESVFTMSDYGPLKISLPAAAPVTDADVDAQIAGYIETSRAEAGGAVEPTDEWVRATFGGLETLAELRSLIRSDLERESRRIVNDLKLQRCNDALAARVEGDIPADFLDEAVASSHDAYLARLREAGTNKIQYMRERNMTEEQFQAAMREDIRYQMLVNVALDKMAEATGTTVSNAELTEYLACEDPESFIRELEEKQRVEDARRVAVRVKMMRRLVDTAEVTIEDADPVFVSKDQARQAVIDQ